MAATQATASASATLFPIYASSSKARRTNNSLSLSRPFSVPTISTSSLSVRSNIARPTIRGESHVAKCEQGVQGGGSGVDMWLGRLAMVGFAVAISVEIATGKGLLENFGLATPLPVVALALTGLVGVLTAIFIFQSSSKS